MEKDMFLDDIALLGDILDGRSPPTKLSLLFLRHITDDFSETRVIGRGGFGVVYKGEFKNRNVAVKKLSLSMKAEEDFTREIDSLMNVNHNNVVRFLGYCNKTESTLMNDVRPGQRRSFVYTQDRVLCFEYVSKGSLTGHIHDELRGHEWDTRYKILKEICQGLKYLHGKNMVHRDLKPDNILLNTLMVPKVADLGICKLLEDGATQAMTTSNNASWTYAAPEFGERRVSLKYDIFSLGKIIIELVTGYTKEPDIKNVLRRWRHRWNKSNDTLRYQQVAKCIEIGLSCQNNKAKRRPSIWEIVKYLDDMDGGTSDVIQEIPCWNELLWVEPLELFFPFEINKQISCSLELHNESDAHMAFFIKTYNKLQYKIDPEKGVVEPCSHFTVNIHLLRQAAAPDMMHNADEFTVKSTRLSEGLRAEDINKDLFSKMSGNTVDKVRIGVVFEEKLRASLTCAACMIKEKPKDLDTKVIDLPREQDAQNTGSDDMGSKTLHKVVPKFLQLEEIKKFTNDFSDVIGIGSHGTVYKGIDDEEIEIAVKVLTESIVSRPDKWFKREFEYLLTLNHQNIIRPVGYYNETDNKYILCFEYAPGGNLGQYMSDYGDGLDWDTCYKIIKGTCEGLCYLHNHPSGSSILHLDLNPKNILLHHGMVPKIADCGLSNLLTDQTSKNKLNRFGNLRYTPQEFTNFGMIGKEFDIYSVGVIILEMIAGTKTYAENRQFSQEDADLAFEKWRPKLSHLYYEQVRTCLQIALQCVASDPLKRPQIQNIIDGLDKVESMTPEVVEYYDRWEPKDYTRYTGRVV